jgi:hypothetical protein
MTETIKVEVDDALARKFRKKAMERYGYKKGTIKKAVEEVMIRFSMSGPVNWGSLRGTLRGAQKASSVQLQHRLWSNQD